MTLFQSIIGVIFSMGFLILLSLLIGYVALPVFFILLAIGLFNFFRHGKLFTRVNQEQITPYRKSSFRRKNDKIIDVDYTELP